MYTHLSVMNRLCNIFLRRDFVAVLNLVDKQGELNDTQASVLAARISKLGRSLTHDNGICKVVVETSVPKLGDAIAAREGSICRKVHVLPMSLEDFKACFAEFALADEEARNVLPKQETAPPKASWFGPTDKTGRPTRRGRASCCRASSRAAVPGSPPSRTWPPSTSTRSGRTCAAWRTWSGKRRWMGPSQRVCVVLVCTCFHSRSHSDQRRAQ